MTLKKDEIFKQLNSGTYVLAVSGGVDSVVLMHLLKTLNNQIIIAHVDHGIREESSWDERFVSELSNLWGYKYMSKRFELGPDTSEATARQHRYEFLESIKEKETAEAIITAHHQDDLLETAILNLQRGTYWKGLVSLDSSEDRLRPLLHYSKKEIYDYALEHKLEWVEDETNLSDKYLRNRIRRYIIPHLDRDKLTQITGNLMMLKQETNDLSKQITKYFFKDTTVNRGELIALPVVVRREIIANYFSNVLKNLSKQEVKGIEHFICTTAPSKSYWPRDNIELRSNKEVVTIKIS